MSAYSMGCKTHFTTSVVNAVCLDMFALLVSLGFTPFTVWEQIVSQCINQSLTNLRTVDASGMDTSTIFRCHLRFILAYACSLKERSAARMRAPLRPSLLCTWMTTLVENQSSTENYRGSNQQPSPATSREGSPTKYASDSFRSVNFKTFAEPADLRWTSGLAEALL